MCSSLAKACIESTISRASSDPLGVLSIHWHLSPITQWWSSKDIGQFNCAPFRLNSVMSYSQFNAIDRAIRYTNHLPPTTFDDKFHDVRQMIDAFNDHYEENYTPSWLNCLDESMNTWLNNEVATGRSMCLVITLMRASRTRSLMRLTVTHNKLMGRSFLSIVTRRRSMFAR
ncbi:hypothetical protein ACHAXN_001218 [Cyclotella atomus]